MRNGLTASPWVRDTRASMSLQGLVRFFLPKEDVFFKLLEQQADVSQLAASALAEFRAEGTSAEDVRAKVQAHEHEGDRLVHELEEALAKTFVTPIDREDIQRLSNELDTVCDLANAAARASAWLGVDRPSEPMKSLMVKLLECTEILKTALPHLRKHDYAALLEAGRKLRTKEKEADVVYREALSALFKDMTLDARSLLRQREVLEDLENAVDHCERVGHTLVNLSVKHG